LAVALVVGGGRFTYPSFDMSWNAVWSVLKWVLAALAAGFIGQFGRVLAMRIIHRRQAQAAQSGRPPAIDPPTPTPETPAELRTREKIEKKRAKAEIKKAKKSQG